ncbi:MAG TPA: hypothetical protein VE842_00375, partial [Pyrinomonadaceae bacterium]|nr:hypothetical protein [Pyrinomonadaceae bacterium]
IDPEAGIIKIEFHGWQSVEAYNQELPSIPGAKKLYQFDGTRYFDVIAMPCSLGPGAPVVAEMVNLANQLAMAEKDVVGPDGPISFFETAIPAS